MKTTLKAALLLATLLVSSSRAHATTYAYSQPSLNPDQPDVDVANFDRFGDPGCGTYWVLGPITVDPEPSVQPSNPVPAQTDVAVRNNDRYVPSTFMSFDQAISLGRQQHETVSSSQPKPGTNPVPLGDVARQLRGTNATPRGNVYAQQDASGKLQVCSSAADCRTL